MWAQSCRPRPIAKLYTRPRHGTRMDRSEIVDTYLSSHVVKKGDYDYFVNPISEGNPAIGRRLLDQITDCIIELCDMDCDVIIAPEAMAIQYGAVLTMKTGIPFQIVRKRGTGLPSEIVFTTKTGYGESRMYVSSLERGTKVMIVDDVISTGGTMVSMVRTLREHGIVVKEAAVVLNRSDDVGAISEKAGIPIRTVLDVGIEDGRPVVRDL